MDDILTISVYAGNGDLKTVNKFKSLLKEYDVQGEFIEETDGSYWILIGTKIRLKQVLKTFFGVWSGPCPILPEEILSEDDCKRLEY